MLYLFGTPALSVSWQGQDLNLRSLGPLSAIPWLWRTLAECIIHYATLPSRDLSYPDMTTTCVGGVPPLPCDW